MRVQGCSQLSDLRAAHLDETRNLQSYKNKQQELVSLSSLFCSNSDFLLETDFIIFTDNIYLQVRNINLWHNISSFI